MVSRDWRSYERLFPLSLNPHAAIVDASERLEEQTRDQKRMDVTIHYLRRRYIIELKIWHGNRYNEKGERQISKYLDYFGLSTGYMLSFNFNQKKDTGVKRVKIGDKVLFEGTV